MINKVIDGITSAIYKEFGAEHEIYNEQVIQDLADASFSVRCVDCKIDRFLNNKFRRTCFMEINYFPADKLNPKTEIQGVIDALFDCLEVIKVDGYPVRGIKAESRIVDNVLVYTLTYIIFTYKVEDVEYMLELTQDIRAN